MPGDIYLRFYEELNDYLPPGLRKREFAFPIAGETSVEHLLRLFGVPREEVELVLVNGISVGAQKLLVPGDRVSVYPVFESVNVAPVLKFRDKPLRRLRFVVETDLAELGVQLRALGFDVLVGSGGAPEEDRILLTSHPEAPASGRTRVYVVRSADLRAQIDDVLSRFDVS